MLKNSPKRIGETIEVTIGFNTSDRTIALHSKLMESCDENEARVIFEHLIQSLNLKMINIS